MIKIVIREAAKKSASILAVMGFFFLFFFLVFRASKKFFSLVVRPLSYDNENFKEHDNGVKYYIGVRFRGMTEKKPF